MRRKRTNQPIRGLPSPGQGSPNSGQQGVGAPNLSAIRRQKRRIRWRTQLAGFLFALPLIIGFLAFNLYPFLASLYYSFTDFSLLGQTTWLGWQNYRQIAEDKIF